MLYLLRNHIFIVVEVKWPFFGCGWHLLLKVYKTCIEDRNTSQQEEKAVWTQ